MKLVEFHQISASSFINPSSDFIVFYVFMFGIDSINILNDILIP